MSYFSTLHKQPPEHKRRFALFVSGAATLLILFIWFTAKFAGPEVIVENENEVSPLESMQASVSESLNALKKSFNDLNSTVNYYGG